MPPLLLLHECYTNGAFVHLCVTDTWYGDTGMGTAIRHLSKNKDTPIQHIYIYIYIIII